MINKFLVYFHRGRNAVKTYLSLLILGVLVLGTEVSCLRSGIGRDSLPNDLPQLLYLKDNKKITGSEFCNLIAFDIRTQSIVSSRPIKFEEWIPLYGLSPDGKWLVGSSLQSARRAPSIYVYDLATDSHQFIPCSSQISEPFILDGAVYYMEGDSSTFFSYDLVSREKKEVVLTIDGGKQEVYPHFGLSLSALRKDTLCFTGYVSQDKESRFPEHPMADCKNFVYNVKTGVTELLDRPEHNIAANGELILFEDQTARPTLLAIDPIGIKGDFSSSITIKYEKSRVVKKFRSWSKAQTDMRGVDASGKYAIITTMSLRDYDILAVDVRSGKAYVLLHVDLIKHDLDGGYTDWISPYGYLGCEPRLQ